MINQGGISLSLVLFIVFVVAAIIAVVGGDVVLASCEDHCEKGSCWGGVDTGCWREM